MRTLAAHLGHERSLHESTQALHFAARKLSPGLVGALQVTCADEAEFECVQAFQRGFVQYLLPALKSGSRAPFTLANLGARYEWGAMKVAEEHFAMHPRYQKHKLLVVKLNAHVGCEPLGMAEPSVDAASQLRVRLGLRQRYDDRESPCCGALAATLGGSMAPFAEELSDAFASEGLDRLEILRDETRIDPHLRPLLAAVVSARLQARKALLDIQDHHPLAPTSYLVVGAVSLNRPGPDSEILCGLYYVDGSTGSREAVYTGLGDDPSKYEVSVQRDRLSIQDDHLGVERKARNHRAMARAEWRARRQEMSAVPEDASALEDLRQSVSSGQYRNAQVARRLLRASLPLLAEAAPIPVALLVFAEGAAGMHHVFRVHRLSKDLESSTHARRILDDVHARIDDLPPEEAEALVELLAREVRR